MTNPSTISGGSEIPRGGDGSVKDMAAGAVETIKQEAAGLVSSVQEKAAEQIEQQGQAATETLTEFAGAIRKAGEALAQSDQSAAARLVKQAADGLEGFSRSLSNKRPDELLNSVRDFGRENPLAFLTGAALVGLALGRFMRSSKEHGASAALPVTPSAGSWPSAPATPSRPVPPNPASGNGMGAVAEANVLGAGQEQQDFSWRRES